MDNFDGELVPQIIKHPSLYFPDGNIIFSVVHENVIHLFRCHKSILLKHSPVFVEMFRLAQTEADGQHEVPDVTLDDAYQDVESLLNLLYDPLKMPYKKHGVDTAQRLCGPLKLATKYQMHSLRKRFISVLKEDWPSSIQDWDKNEAELARKLEENDSAAQEIGPYPEPAQVICLARECNIPTILPAAFYHLGRCYHVEENERRYNQAKLELLSKDDWKSLMRGRDKMYRSLATYFHEFLSKRRVISSQSACNNTPPDRPDIWGCKSHVRDWWTANCFDLLVTEPGILADPLDVLNNLSDFVANAHQICGQCRRWVQASLRAEREQMWSRLAEYFELNLEDMRGHQSLRL